MIKNAISLLDEANWLHGHKRTKSFVEFQSAYRAAHSTETAFVDVSNVIITRFESNNNVILLPLDVSATFDTIDHETMIVRLKIRI